MQKTQAVASLGQHRLMLPAWVKAALSANDRLKVYLTVVQSASSHASHPHRDVPDLGKEIAAAGLNTAWLHDLAAVARRVDEELFIPDLPRLVKCVEDDLATMAQVEMEPKAAGRNITMTLSPLPANKRKRRFSLENEEIEEDKAPGDESDD